MKSRIITVFTAFVLAFLPLSVHAQDPAMYIYRNDGRLNAFLMDLVDSTSYSCIGIDGIDYATPVVQEIWTKDSLYRIPLSAIDSISYETPEPIFKKGLFFIDESNVSSVESVDFETLSITFHPGTTSLPSQGQIIYCELEEEPFPMGFAGRVLDVSGNAFECEPVGPEEVYDRLLIVGRVDSDGSEMNSSKRRARRKTHSEPTYNISTTLANLVTLSGKGTLVLDYTLDINAFNDEPASFYMKMKHDLEVGLTVGVKEKDMEGAFNSPYAPDEKVKEVWGWPIEVLSIGILHLDVNVGAYFSYGGEFSIELSGLKYKYTNIREFYWTSNHPFQIAHTNLYDEGKWSDFQDDVKLSAELSGKVSFGACAEIAAVVWKPKWLSLGMEFKIGPELKGSVSIDTDLLKSESFGTAFYKEFSENVKLTLGVKVGADLRAQFKGKKDPWTIVSLSTTLFPQTVTLFPKLTKPKIPKIFQIGLNRYYFETFDDWDSNDPMAVKTIAKNIVLFPGPIGLEIQDSQGNVLYSKTGEGFDNWHWVKNSSFSTKLTSFQPQKLKVYPQFKLFGLFPFKSEPSEITIPEPMSLSKESVEILEGQSTEIIINGGWGYYQYIPLEYEHIAPRSLKKKEDGTQYIHVIGEKAGSTEVTVTDVRSGRQCVCNITVKPTPIELSATSLELYEGETRMVTIYPRRNYKLESSRPDVAEVTVDMENVLKMDLNHLSSQILITGKGIGNATITIKDPDRGHTAYIDVEVTEAGPGVIEISPTTLNFGVVMPGQEVSKTFKVSNKGESNLAFSIGTVEAPFTIAEANQSFRLKPNEERKFTVTCSGLEEGDKKSVFVPIESDVPGSSGMGILLKASGDSYTEGICFDIYPPDGAVVQSNGGYFDCKVRMPWNGEMNLQYSFGDKPDMSNIVYRVRITGNGRTGDVIRAFGTSVDRLKPNTKYYWRIAYFDFAEEETWVNCTPIMTFTTGSE